MLTTLFTICLVVFIYMHVMHQLKTSNDLEIFEIDAVDKPSLEEACCLRQPLLLDYWLDDLARCTPAQFTYGAFDVNVVDASGESVPVPLDKARALFAKSTHYTERNDDFLKETMLHRILEKNDGMFRPPMIAAIRYDIIFGAVGACTKLRYSDWYRNYFLVADGTLKLKLSPPRNAKYLSTQKDYLKHDYYSSFSAWGSDELARVKFLELDVRKGQLVHIPAYWWYSFKLGKDACVLGFQYRTWMNAAATLPDTALGMLQRHNTTLVTLKHVITPTLGALNSGGTCSATTTEVV